MQLAYGNYFFEVNGVKVTTQNHVLVGTGHNPYGYRETVNVSGFLTSLGQDALTIKENLLRAALKIQYQNLAFYCDDGTLSGIVMTNANSISGVTITDGPNFPMAVGPAPEYSTLRSFNFTAEAEFALLVNELVSWTETLDFSGGGPIFVMKRALNGLPQRQKVYDNVEFRVLQYGSAVGYLKPPSAPAPIWPARLRESPNITNVSPERVGRGRKNYKIEWHYIFESEYPLIGVPHPWPGF